MCFDIKNNQVRGLVKEEYFKNICCGYSLEVPASVAHLDAPSDWRP